MSRPKSLQTEMARRKCPVIETAQTETPWEKRPDHIGLTESGRLKRRVPPLTALKDLRQKSLHGGQKLYIQDPGEWILLHKKRDRVLWFHFIRENAFAAHLSNLPQSTRLQLFELQFSNIMKLKLTWNRFFNRDIVFKCSCETFDFVGPM